MMRTLLLVAMTVAVVVAGGEVQEESHSRYKRQSGRRQNFGSHGRPGRGRPFGSSPQKFVRDPITGQYVPDVDRDSFGNPVGNFPATGFPGANVGGFHGGQHPGGGFHGGQHPGGGFHGGQRPGGGFHGGQRPGGGFHSGQGGGFHSGQGGGFQGGQGGGFHSGQGGGFHSGQGGGFQGGQGGGFQGGQGGGFQGGNLPTSSLFEVFQQLPQLAQLQQGAGSTAGGGAGGGAGFPNVSDYARLNIGNGQPDVRYQECVTPRRQFGRCRHLQYCILPEFLNNYSLFVRYACVIRNTFIGVCCSRHTVDLGTTLELSTPTPTPAPAPRCGVSDRTTTRIVGGVATSPGEFPWVVSILRRDATPNQYCAGVLISNRHVLTVAHCLAGFDFRHIWARVGEHDFDREGDTPSTNVRIADFRLHKDFNPRDFNNDIAILVLEQPVIYNDFVIPICLPPSSQQFTGDTVTVAGWGAVKHEGPVSSVLRKVSLPVWTNTDCDEAYDQPIRDSMICAGFPGGGRDACQDDSGGPMMVQVNGTWTIVGLVSFGVKCAEPGIPGVYTRVNYFLDWISDNI
ncbi:proclotting enzyme-like isoform X3 [Homarus americanus]|uniref:proclotting enzyme-like isoform X3 n=1 Tax=Homarus americanus TaxID=6706 RepID=UPI001C453EE8|nr:proclotting enzyme-like isoform X3 [Homarus americanus]